MAVRRADAVYAPVALHEPHRVPRQVEVDDVPRLLEVHALGEHVGRNKQVVGVLRPSFGACEETGAKPKRTSSVPPLLPVTVVRRPRYGARRGVGVACRSSSLLLYPVYSVGVVGEDDDLPLVALVVTAWTASSFASVRDPRRGRRLARRASGRHRFSTSLGLLGEAEEKIPVGLDGLAQTLHVVVGGGIAAATGSTSAAMASGSNSSESVRSQAARASPVRTQPSSRASRNASWLLRHLAAGAGEGVDGGLEALEKPERRSPAAWSSKVSGSRADTVGGRGVAGEGELLAVVEVRRRRERAVLRLHVRAERVGEALEETGHEAVELVGLAQHLGLREGYRDLLCLRAGCFSLG